MSSNFPKHKSADDCNDTDVVLSVEGVSKSFILAGQTIHALRDITLKLPKGRITGLIGPDGAGKTTLMRLICGLLLPNTGHITVLGSDVRNDTVAVQKCVGYMPQRFGLYEDLSVQENLDLYANLHSVPPSARNARYDELMNMTGLEPFLRRLAGKLSGGMKQKLGLACTLVGNPELLLLDEPTVGVDPVSRRELWSIVYRLVREQGTSVLLSTAYLDEAERCEELFLLHEGQCLGAGPPKRFSAGVEGHSYLIKTNEISKRKLQEKLSRASEVVDAIIQSEHVRVVMADNCPPSSQELLPDLTDVTVEPVAPRFEDSFITLIKSRSASQKQTPMVPAADKQGEKTPSTDGPLIEVQNVKRMFGDFCAVNNVSFNVNRGEVFGLLGANGAGKTTLFRMLCGLLPVSAGRVRVTGRDLRHAASTARERIGYMSQRFSLYENLTVHENLRFFSSAYGLKGKKQHRRIASALEDFGLQAYTDAPSADLPLGFKQRLALAASLLHKPDVLFLDEPTSGVDPLARREFWRRINDLAEAGVTVLVTTHFMAEAEFCDRLVIMAQGEVLAESTPAKIKARFRTPEHPAPTLEDAFIHLIENSAKKNQAA